MADEISKALGVDSERKTPFAQDAEASVLGAMLMEREAIGAALETIDENCFYLDNHRKLYRAIVALYEKNVVVDPVTLSDQLKKNDTLEEVGGLEFIYEIANSVPTSANVVYHARIVREKAMLRQLIESCTSIVRASYEPLPDPDKIN